MISVNSRRRIVTYGLHEVCMRQPWTMCLNRVIYSSDSQDHQRRSTRPDFNGYFFCSLLIDAGRHMPPCWRPDANPWGGIWKPAGRHMAAGMYKPCNCRCCICCCFCRCNYSVFFSRASANLVSSSKAVGT